MLPCPTLVCELVVATPEYCGYWDWCCTEARVVALGSCAVWGCVLRADCKRTSPISEMLRFAGFTVTHGGHSSYPSNRANVIRIALGVNVLVNKRRCVERRIMLLLLLHTGHGSATRLHDVRPGARIRFIVRPSMVVNLLRIGKFDRRSQAGE